VGDRADVGERREDPSAKRNPTARKRSSPWGPHRGGEGLARDSDLERLLDRDRVELLAPFAESADHALRDGVHGAGLL